MRTELIILSFSTIITSYFCFRYIRDYLKKVDSIIKEVESRGGDISLSLSHRIDKLYRISRIVGVFGIVAISVIAISIFVISITSISIISQ